MNKKIIILAVVAIIALSIFSELYQMIDVKIAIDSKPNDKFIQFNENGKTIEISERDYWREYVAKEQLNCIQFYLLEKPYFILNSLLYMMMGLFGGGAFHFICFIYPKVFGLDANKLEHLYDAQKIFARCFLAMLSGVIMFFLIVSINGTDLREHIYQKLVILPVFAGLFTDTFYRYIRKLFPTIMDKIFKKGGNSK